MAASAASSIGQAHILIIAVLPLAVLVVHLISQRASKGSGAPQQRGTDRGPQPSLRHASPSPEDVLVTRAIIPAGQLLDIDVLDHLIIGHATWVSLRERGLGFE